MSEADTYEKLVQEAVAVHGADMDAVEAYVEERIRRMEPSVQTRIRRDLKRLVGFRAPDQSPFDPN